MEIWLDSADIQFIQNASALGVISGVTTNPSIIAQSGMDLEDALSEILKCRTGLVTAQVLSTQSEEIVEEAESLRDFSERLIIKIPVTQEGLKAMHALEHLKLPIMATAIMTPFQALLACHAGATFLAPYLSHIEEISGSHDHTLPAIVDLIETYGFDAKLVVASLRHLDQMTTCLELGVPAVTLKPDLFNELISDHPTTLSHIERFRKDAMG